MRFPFCLTEPFNMTTVRRARLEAAVWVRSSQLSLDTTCMCFPGTEYGSLFPNSASTAHILLSSLNPLDSRKWRRKPWSWRVFKVIKVPAHKIHSRSQTERFRMFSSRHRRCIGFLHPSDTDRGAAPAVHPSRGPGQRGQELEKTAQLPATCHRSSGVCAHLPVRTMWGRLCRKATSRQHRKKTPETSVLFARLLLCLDANHMIQGQFPLWLLIFLMGLFLSIIVFFTTRNDCPPRYHPVRVCHDYNKEKFLKKERKCKSKWMSLSVGEPCEAFSMLAYCLLFFQDWEYCALLW